MTEKEMVDKYGEEATEYFLDLYYTDTPVAVLIEIIVNLKAESGELDADMDAIKAYLLERNDDD